MQVQTGIGNDEFFERKLLIGMITSTEFLEKVISKLNVTIFESPEIGTVAKWCIDHFKQYQKAPGQDIQDIYMVHLNAGELSKVKAEYIEEMLTSHSEEFAEQAEEIDTNFLYDQTIKYIQTRELRCIQKEVDALVEQGKTNEAEELLKGINLTKGSVLSSKTETITGGEVMIMEITQTKWVVPGLIPEGLSILAGKSKLGKSFLVLGMAVALSRGGKVLGKIQVEPTETLYLALEDPLWRIKNRLEEMEVDKEEVEQLHIAISWEKGTSGIAHLDAWLQEHPNTKMVFIDVLERFRSPERKSEQIYRGDYRDVMQIKELANKHNIAIVLLHHTRKAASRDDVDLILGSTGLAGAADTLLIMKRARGENTASLFITGRDVEERTLVLSKSYKYGWRLEDADIRELDQTPERQELVQILREANGAMQLKSLAELTGKSVHNVRNQLKPLVEKGIIRQPSFGWYEVTGLSKPKLMVVPDNDNSSTFKGKVRRKAKMEREH